MREKKIHPLQSVTLTVTYNACMHLQQACVGVVPQCALPITTTILRRATVFCDEIHSYDPAIVLTQLSRRDACSPDAEPHRRTPSNHLCKGAALYLHCSDNDSGAHPGSRLTHHWAEQRRLDICHRHGVACAGQTGYSALFYNHEKGSALLSRARDKAFLASPTTTRPFPSDVAKAIIAKCAAGGL